MNGPAPLEDESRLDVPPPHDGQMADARTEALLHSAPLQRPQERQPCANLEALFQRYPRLLVEGESWIAEGRILSEADLRRHYEAILREPSVIQLACRLLDEQEIAEGDLKRHLPQVSLPVFHAIDLVVDPEFRFLGASNVEEKRLAINCCELPPFDGGVLHAVLASVLRHEIGEVILREDKELITVLESLPNPDSQREYFVDLIRRGFPGHALLEVPNLGRDEINVLWTPEDGEMIWDTIADAVALRLAEGGPSETLVGQGLRKLNLMLIRHERAAARSLTSGEFSLFGIQHLYSSLASLAKMEALAIRFNDAAQSSLASDTAERLLRCLERDRCLNGREAWRPRYRSAVEDYVKILAELRLKSN